MCGNGLHLRACVLAWGKLQERILSWLLHRLGYMLKVVQYRKECIMLWVEDNATIVYCQKRKVKKREKQFSMSIFLLGMMEVIKRGSFSPRTTFNIQAISCFLLPCFFCYIPQITCYVWSLIECKSVPLKSYARLRFTLISSTKVLGHVQCLLSNVYLLRITMYV